MARIGILGAGLAGLTVALHRLGRGDSVTLFESSARAGGQLLSERDGGFVIEHGAEGFVAGSEAVARLAESVGLAGEIIGQSVERSCHYDGEKLVRLAPGEAGRLLGFQVGRKALGKGIQSFSRGMSQLVEGLQLANAEAALRFGAEVTEVRPEPGGAAVVLGDEVIHFDRVVVAVPATAAAVVLGAAFGEAATALNDSDTLSSATVSLAFPAADVGDALDATGFVVAEAAQREGFRACTFASSKLAGRAPRGQVLLRLFFRPAPGELSGFGDAEWVARARRCLGRALDVSARPARAWVSRWDRALPVFDDAHRARVRRLEAKLDGSGVILAGAAFHGSGIDGAVRSAEAAALALD